MLLERATLCGGAILLLAATSASADEPIALTSSQLDGVTVLRFLPDQLNPLRVTVEGATDDSDSLADEIIMEELEERGLRLAADSLNSAPAGAQNSPPAGTQNSASTGTQNSAAAATAAIGGGASGSWTETGSWAYTGTRTSRGTSTWTRNSTASNRVETASSNSASNDVSRSRPTGWSSQRAVASEAAHRRLPDGRARTSGLSTPASRHWASVAQIRSEAGRILHRLQHQAVSARRP
jgi:hypothetical protein